MILNKKKAIGVVSVIVFLAVFMITSGNDIRYFFAEMIYGGENPIESSMIFSKKSGFYGEDFDLKIYAPTKEIYYTLDGSEPTIDSIKYETPIRITDASVNENVYSSRTDVCGSFLTEDSLYQVPDYLVDKCTVLRAIYFDSDGNASEAETRVFFVGYGSKTGYEGVNVIAVTSDSENLFGEENGIYVLGAAFSDYQKEHDLSERNYYRWEANYLNRGKEWEREANIQVFNTGKELVLSQNVGVRIQGGVSRGLLPKSLNFYARSEYGDNRLTYDFFDTGYYPQRVTLSGGGNDYYGKILDRLGAELSEDLEFCTMHYVPYVLFLNGEYWGIYHLTEKYDDHYIEQYYDVESDNVVIVKNGNLERGTEEDLDAYDQMKNFVEYADMTVEENYQMACTMLDMQSMIDYFAAEIYMARQVDWPSSNYALWRSRTVSDKPYEDGKWRWMLFDVNTAAMVDDFIDHDTLAYVLEESSMFANLYKNREFRLKFQERLREMKDTVFEPSKVKEILTQYEQELAEPMENNHQRFFGSSNEPFLYRVKIMKEFIDQRPDYIETMIQNNEID